jgi:hypothetical protein
LNSIFAYRKYYNLINNQPTLKENVESPNPLEKASIKSPIEPPFIHPIYKLFSKLGIICLIMGAIQLFYLFSDLLKVNFNPHEIFFLPISEVSIKDWIIIIIETFQMIQIYEIKDNMKSQSEIQKKTQHLISLVLLLFLLRIIIFNIKNVTWIASIRSNNFRFLWGSSFEFYISFIYIYFIIQGIYIWNWFRYISDYLTIINDKWRKFLKIGIIIFSISCFLAILEPICYILIHYSISFSERSKLLGYINIVYVIRISFTIIALGIQGIALIKEFNLKSSPKALNSIPVSHTEGELKNLSEKKFILTLSYYYYKLVYLSLNS